MQTDEQVSDFIDHMANNPVSADQLVALTFISKLQHDVLAGDAKTWLAIMGTAFIGVAEAIGYDPFTALMTLHGVMSAANTDGDTDGDADDETTCSDSLGHRYDRDGRCVWCGAETMEEEGFVHDEA